WHHSGGRTRHAGAAHHRHVLRSLPGPGGAGGFGQHLGTIDLSSCRSHADRRGSATERRENHDRAGTRTSRGPAVTHESGNRVIELLKSQHQLPDYQITQLPNAKVTLWLKPRPEAWSSSRSIASRKK